MSERLGLNEQLVNQVALRKCVNTYACDYTIKKSVFIVLFG